MTTANECPYRWIALCVLGIGLLTPATTNGQTVDPQRALAAQALYDQATAEMDANNYASACPRLEEVTRLVPEGVGARLTLARCYEAIDKLASAWSQYALAQGLAVKVGQQQRAQDAAQKAAELKPKLATMRIEVAEATRKIPDLVVTRDGVPVGAPQWGMALPVDVGPHDVVAMAPGYVTRKKAFEVITNGAEIVVTLPRLQPDLTSDVEKPENQQRIPIGPAPSDRSWQRPVGIASVTFGAVGLGAGLVLGAVALSKNADSNEGNHCDARDRCDAIGLALRDEARELGNGSTAAVIIGAAALAGGVTLWATAPKNDKVKPEALKVSLGWGTATFLGVW